MVDALSGLTGNTAISVQESGSGRGGETQIEQRAKSMGVPDSIIAKGKNAIKAWAKENGKGPYSMNKQNESQKMREGNKETAASLQKSDNLMQQLEANGISQDNFSQAVEKGPAATKELFSSFNFNLNITA
ncbi:MAG: hypothetical protein DWQ05_01680 [Calditrichaeota bacterium]|nr:MAG: hypothetical protein DWQ05_01680 [Calditrichota bacterium]